MTQRRTDTPIIFCGPGYVNLDRGGLKYVVYHTCVSDEAHRHMTLNFAGQAGELVTEDSLFDF